MLKHRAALFSQRMQLQRRKRQRAAADLKKHRRLLEDQQCWQVETFLLMAGVALSLPAPRRTVQRAEGGWRGSTLYGYLQHGDDILYKKKFRVTRDTLEFITEKLCSNGDVTDNRCRDPAKQVTAVFKVACCMYFLAHGCADYGMVADVASIGDSTLWRRMLLADFSKGVIEVLAPIFMPATPPPPDVLRKVRAEFKSRRGIANIAMAVDGTHVPFRGGPDYRNYKGWTSIMALAWVNSFHLFVDADVGASGRAGDNGVLKNSHLLQQIRQNPEAWLGEHGMVAADGGASDGGAFLLNPIADPRDVQEQWYNFCHSSTRFFVEETFGRWKNRFRFLLRENHMSHANATRLIYVSMILHNLCTIRNDDAVDFREGADEEWMEFFDKYARMSCPTCTRARTMHCPHVKKWRDSGESIPVSGDARARRDAIKNQMWQELCDDDTLNRVPILDEMQRRTSLGRASRWAAHTRPAA